MTAETGELAAGPAAALVHGRRARPRTMERLGAAAISATCRPM